MSSVSSLSPEMEKPIHSSQRLLRLGNVVWHDGRSIKQGGGDIKVEEHYEVVTDVAEIARLNKQLAKHLRAALPYKESREITYPSGHQTGMVYFEAQTGTRLRAWSAGSDSDKLMNLLLSADPGSTKWIEIAVQLNFPAGTYNRRIAGAFIRDADGEIFVAHRGKLTKGRAGLPKDKVFREFAATTVEAADHRKKTSRVILIAGLNHPELVDRLWEFAEEAREVATRLGEELHGDGENESVSTAPRDPNGPNGSNGGKASDPAPTSPAERLLKLRAYFDEYSGEVRTKGHGGGKRTVEHGAIVRALEARLRGGGDSQKAQAIDLAIVATSSVDLFEVKTSAWTTDVYTGVGQLLIHGECIMDELGIAVNRYLVLPEKPKASHSKAISGKPGIKVVTYQKVGSTYEFNGLS
ncbi:hypothetical protein [Paraburkholderia bannensis]|uniref:hypothetical protein n=1 Tax=Paraburkholderia bannensis TaxID=765414 RepID=UPI000A96451B|nr:hypothetical protein [Paraburkholderia bannensis]